MLSRHFIVCAAILGATTPVFAQQLPPPASASTEETAPVAKPITPTRVAQPTRAAQNSSVLPPPASAPENSVVDVKPKETTPVAPDEGVLIVPPDASEIPLPTRNKRPQISIGGVDVSGLTQFAAQQKLRSAHASRLSQPVVLRLGAREWWTTRTQLGASLDFASLWSEANARAATAQNVQLPLAYKWDANVAKQFLQSIAPTILRAPQAIGVDSSGMSTGRAGAELSPNASLTRIREALQSVPPQNDIELIEREVPFVPRKVRESDAELAQKALAKQALENASGNAQFPVLLSSYSTKYNPRLRDRTVNLEVSAREVDGTILQPGEVFSANRAIGPRSTSRGFRAAHIFMGKRVVDGVGGGICQCATTVYNAAVKANLKIVERHSHSLPVPYATKANDATIYWGQKDMRFRNTTNVPILVKTFLRDGRFHAQIFAAR